MTLERARSGDASAFRELVEQNSRRLFALAYRMTGSEQDAEDVVQETFLRAYRKLPEWETRAQFSTWLFRIASNCAIDLQRRRKRWRTTSLDADGAGPLSSGQPGQERSLQGQEIGARLTDALDELSVRERTAFALRHYEGLPVAEIADLMGLRLSATKNHIFRAVRKLRGALEPWREGGR